MCLARSTRQHTFAIGPGNTVDRGSAPMEPNTTTHVLLRLAYHQRLLTTIVTTVDHGCPRFVRPFALLVIILWLM